MGIGRGATSATPVTARAEGKRLICVAAVNEAATGNNNHFATPAAGWESEWGLSGHAVPRQQHPDHATDTLGLLGSGARGW